MDGALDECKRLPVYMGDPFRQLNTNKSLTRPECRWAKDISLVGCSCDLLLCRRMQLAVALTDHQLLGEDGSLILRSFCRRQDLQPTIGGKLSTATRSLTVVHHGLGRNWENDIVLAF